MIVVLSVAAIVLAIAIPRVLLTLDRVSVRAAAGDVVTLLNTARTLALASHEPVAVDFCADSGAVRVRRGKELVAVRSVATLYQVTFTSSRDSMAYDSRGLGYGAANLSLVIRRGAAADTVFVSRLGRVR